MLAPKWGESQYEKCIEKCDEAIRLGQAAKGWVQREERGDEEHFGQLNGGVVNFLREHHTCIAKAYLRKGMAHHARREYKQAHKALDTCIHCDFDMGLNMIMKECGVAAEAKKERKKLLETEKTYPERQKRRRKRMVS